MRAESRCVWMYPACTCEADLYTGVADMCPNIVAPSLVSCVAGYAFPAGQDEYSLAARIYAI